MGRGSGPGACIHGASLPEPSVPMCRIFTHGRGRGPGAQQPGPGAHWPWSTGRGRTGCLLKPATAAQGSGGAGRPAGKRLGRRREPRDLRKLTRKVQNTSPCTTQVRDEL